MIKLSKLRKKIWLSLVFVALVMLVCLLSVWSARDGGGASVANSTGQSNVWIERLVAPVTPTNRNIAEVEKVSPNVSASMNADNHYAQVCKDFVGKNDPKKIAKDTRELMYAHLRRTDPKLEERLKWLLESGDLRQKASALVLQAEMARGNARESYLKLYPNCETDQACQLELNRLQMAAAIAPVDAVAKMAAYSRDPILYATAFNACASLPSKKEGFCTQVNAAQWASRDPENGAPWLHGLQELSQDGSGVNQSTIADAIYKISKAKRFDAHTNILSQLPTQFLPANDHITHARLEDLAFYIALRSPMPSYRPIISACKGSALNDGNRREMCENLANQLQRENASFVEVILSGKIGEQLGWDKVRTQSIQDDRDAIRGMLVDKANKALTSKKSPEDVMKLCLDDLGASHKLRRIDVEGEYTQYQDELKKYPVARAELIRMGKM